MSIPDDFGLEAVGPGRMKPLNDIAPRLDFEKTSDKSAEMSFKDLLKGLVEQVDSLQKDADDSIKGLMTGETTDIHDVTVKMQEAGIAFDLMMEIRNKLLEAYQQIIKM